MQYTTYEFIRDNYIWIGAIIVFLFVLILALFMHNAVMMRRKVKEKEQHRKELQAQFDIVDSLAQSYDGVYFIDIKNEKYETICNTGLLSLQNIDATGSTRVLYEYLCSKAVRYDYRRDASKFFALNTVSERLCEKRSIAMQFMSAYDSWFEAMFVPVDKNETGEYLHVIATVKLIQDQKEDEQKQNAALHEALENAKEAGKAKNRFLLNMSHDIRTPMNAIMGFGELLEKNLDNREKVEDYISKIKTANEYLLDLLDNVLEIARFENGSITLEEEPADISVLMENIAAEVEMDAKKKNIELLSNLNVDSLPLMLDSRKLREVIFKLVSNAVAYTEEGGKIAFDAEETFSDDCKKAKVKISISDTGIGMTEEFLPHIFEEFSREKNSTESKVIGAGLGLNLVKKLVNIMGGRIEVESKKGVGTTFTLLFDFAIASGVKEEEFNDEEVISILRGRNILIAEDNDMNAEITQTILETIGVASERAGNGIECVEMVEKAPAGFYDLILMDVQMPVLDGYQATARIRRMSDIAKKNIPIIALTANAYEEDRQNSFDAGMDGYLTKPINSKKLFIGMARILEH